MLCFLYSCEDRTITPRTSICDKIGRELTKEELSIFNFQKSDSMVLTCAGNDYYIVCKSKEYKRVIHKYYDNVRSSWCFGDTVSDITYQLNAVFNTNIYNKDGSILQLILSVYHYEPSPKEKVASCYIFFHTTKDYGPAYYLYVTMKCSDKIYMHPGEDRNNNPDYPIPQRYFLEEKKKITLNGHVFKDVYIMSCTKDYSLLHYFWGGDPEVKYYVDTVYYQKNYGIIKIVYNDMSYEYKALYRGGKVY